MTVVLKVGGSIVTEKDRPETVDEPTLARVASSIAQAELDRLVVIHGGGSFGHPPAAAHGVSPADGTRDVAAVLAIHGAMCRLNDAVVDRLVDRGVPAVPVHPLSAAVRSADGDLRLDPTVVATLLDEGFVPVLHGDVVAHAGAGASILSGDELVTILADGLDADRIGVCTGVPGVLDAAGAVVPRVSSYDDVAADLGESEDVDVTGGMAAKVRSLLALDTPGHVFGLDDLAAFLAGDAPGTRVG